MSSLIFPGIILLLVGLWGVFATGRKFRAEFKARGKTWESASDAVKAGNGMIVVDIVWGPQRGLGHPAIWYLPTIPPADEDLTPLLEPGGPALLVNCPRKFRDLQTLRGLFPKDKVRQTGWDSV